MDVAQFEDLVAEGRRRSAEGELALASSVLGDALRLRRGEPLSEFAYAGFADADRAHLNELTLVATESRVEADLGLGRHNDLVGELEALCREHPLRERLWELLMLALYRAGRQAEALRAYAEIRDRLVSELGIDPGSALRELETRIIVQDPSLAAEQQRPPMPALLMAPVAGNLPEPLSSFLGRSAELGQLGEAFRSSRLVTHDRPRWGGQDPARGRGGDPRARGVPGRGLADRVGRRGRARGGGADRGGGARCLGAVRLVATQPPQSTADLIVRHLVGRSLVVVLDNCEHVIDEAATLAQTLLGTVPGLRLLATSREPLGVPGEFLIPVAGLTPSLAAELFVDRARAVLPGFQPDEAAEQLIEGICRRLDGLPLGDRARLSPPPGTPPVNARRATRRPLRAAHPRRPHGAAAPANPASGRGLELRPPLR